MEGLLTVKEVSKVNPDKVYDLIKRGHLKAFKLGALKTPIWAVEEFIKINMGKDLSDLDNIKEMSVLEN